jgi:dUTP pyrophosphatase
MKIKKLHANAIMPTMGSTYAGAFDVYMPEAGTADGTSKKFPLGFSTAIPKGHVALLLPRSGVGASYGLELNNSTGIIDSDYRGEWKAALRTKSGIPFSWEAGERLLQFVIAPIAHVVLQEVEDLDATDRGEGGFGSSGK